MDFTCTSCYCSIHSRSDVSHLGSVSLHLVAQQVESNLITPNIMGKSLDIHPLTVISLVLAAGNIAGFIGIINCNSNICRN